MRRFIGTSRYCVFGAFLFLGRNYGVLVKALVTIMYLFSSVRSGTFLRLLVIFARRNRRYCELLPSAFGNVLCGFDNGGTWTLLCVIVIINGLSNRFISNSICHCNVFATAVNAPYFEVPSIEICKDLDTSLFPFNVCACLTRRLTYTVLTCFHTIGMGRCNGNASTLYVLIVSVVSRGLSFCNCWVTARGHSLVLLSDAFISTSVLSSIAFTWV